jgi:UbiD family decarboxylase
MVPSDSEFVIEGIVDFKKLHSEGPFVDLTGTYDIVREQPVFEVTAITHREDAIWHALLPGGLEHKLLMGMPREPTIFERVNQVVNRLDVHITPGGSSWLHAVVQIKKQSDDDGIKAIHAAFAGHRSCKHVFIVDEDIDLYDSSQVEWAMATRFQGNRGMVVKAPEQGSSLDPSSDPLTHFTTKIGFDLTKPVGTASKSYERVEFPKVDLDKYFPFGKNK